MLINIRFKVVEKDGGLSPWMDSTINVMQTGDLDLIHDRARDAIHEKHLGENNDEATLVDYYICGTL